MLLLNPSDLGKLGPEERDREIARLGLIAELDAINLYEQLAAVATDPLIRKVLLDVAREEKTHVGEFLAILLRYDPEQPPELQAGKREVEELSD